MDKTNYIKNLILSKEKDIKTWAVKKNIPYTTIRNVLQRGVDKTTTTTMNKICMALNISMSELEKIDILEKLEEQRINTITIINRNKEKQEYTLNDSDIELISNLLKKITKSKN
jgi:hypothetical protein